jgi:periplasmic protein TonB
MPSTTSMAMSEQAIPTSPQTRRTLAGGTVASLLLHAAIVALLLANLRFDRPAERPRETTVEVVMVAKEPDTPPQPAPEETKQAETKAPDLPATVRPPPPQLQEAPIAERSQAPPQPTQARPQPRAGLGSAGPSPIPAPDSPPARPAPKADLSTGGGANIIASLPRAGGGDKAAQDEKDFLLAQVMPFWLLNYRDPRYQHVVFRGHFVLQADGMLGAPFGKNDPWDPDKMIAGYAQIQGRQHEAQRLAIESFLRAVRSAQPFRLPPGERDYPRSVPVFFRLGDL